MKALLRAFGIGYKPADRQFPHCIAKLGPVLLVSPFYGALFTPLLPSNSGVRMISYSNPGGCPLLPVAYWKMSMSEYCGSGMPFANALPYGAMRGVVWKKSWKAKNLGKMLFDYCKVVRVDPRFRELMVGWYLGKK